MKYVKNLILNFIIMLILSVSLVPIKTNADSTTVNDVLNSMSLEEKVAQMLIPSFRYNCDSTGNNCSGVTEINSNIEGILQKYGFGGVILFKENTATTEQTVRLVDSLQSANLSNKTGLLIMTDQEGGSVTRPQYSTVMPGNMALAATNNPALSYKAGKVIGSELSLLGINTDFAPVVDVNSNPNNPVIGIRSFSDSPYVVSSFATNFMQGLNSEGVTASLKHFPGHGDTAVDSHTGLPVIYKSYDELKNSDLIPFKTLIDNGANMIMTAHIRYPNIDGSTYTSTSTGEEITLPATLSKRIITDILRSDMGYNGVVVTDAMNMDAVAKHFNRLDSARLAINAGVDMILMPVEVNNSQGFSELENYISSIVNLVNDGTISVDTIDNAVRRILTLKDSKGLLSKYDNSNLEGKISNAKNNVSSMANHNTEWEIALSAVTLVKNSNNVLPIKNSDQKTVILYGFDSHVNSIDYAISKLVQDGKIPSSNNIVKYKYTASLEEILGVISDATNVILLNSLYSSAEFDPNTADGADSKKIDEIINYAHLNNKNFIYLSCRLPYDVARFQESDAIMLTYYDKGLTFDLNSVSSDILSYGANIPAAIYQIFDSTAIISGKLPVNIPNLNSSYQYDSTNLYERGYGLSYISGEGSEEKINTNTSKVKTTPVKKTSTSKKSSNSKTKTTRTATRTRAKNYIMLRGANSKYKKGEELLLKTNGDIEKFVKLLIDGLEVTNDKYTLEKGSTIIKLQPFYLDTLSVGKHKVTFVYQDGEVSTEFSIPNIGKVSTDKSVTENKNDNTKKTTATSKFRLDEKAYYFILLGLLISFVACRVIIDRKNKGASK